ncbi:lipid A biosynthesis acyltransferase [Chitinivibrio alkaliphilus ACht1]|uniref:Lipid A biosynthesis acyltransferase n=2 Tax=Chitinivibrio TaxID=1505231 RepID=U7D8X6_9BACT|nr:lipid A biosynthesis acyltransferase [Chitinivibrio alkaliphilus ACht1]
MTRRVFRNLLIAFLDAVRLPELTDREFHQWIEFDETVLQNAYRKGRGVIVLSGHLSAFELQSQIAQSFSYQNITVGSTLFDPRVETIIQEIRSRRGVHYIPRKNSLGKIIKALKNGAVFGVLIDQDTTKEGVFVPFLGQPAFTPTTSIKLAVKYDIPIIYVATYRDTTGKYHIVSHPCEIPATGDSVQDIYNIAKDFNQFYSSYIEQYPEQWVWIHDRWKRTPPSPPETKGKHHEN